MNETEVSPPTLESHVENIRVRQVKRLVTPARIKIELPIAEANLRTVVEGRETVKAILNGQDKRLLVVVGPCSIHDPKAAMDYARRLKALAEKVAGHFYLVMRVYFEKPRTTVGWKGLINDPFLDDSCDLDEGLHRARKLLLDLTALGLPAATEFLDPIVPQHIADLISWTAIGARTTESQTHREMASGLSMPVGFKNGTDGSVQTAIDAMKSCQSPHSFMGIDQDGMTSVIKTIGNPDCHIVLRGGRRGPNYDAEHTAEAAEKMKSAGLRPALMVDCSHANSNKKPSKQPSVFHEILRQRQGANSPIIGAMLESFLGEGNQSLPEDLSQLRYGVSITDGCLSWEATEQLLLEGVESPVAA